MPAGTNVPVLVGPVALVGVQSMTINEGYDVNQVEGSRFVQATQPTRKQIGIEAVLAGRRRLAVKKALEALALTSRALASTSSIFAPRGISVVSGLTISLDMQITGLTFTQSVTKRDAMDVSITLLEVPQASLFAAVGDAVDLDMAAGSPLMSRLGAPGLIARGPLNALV